MRADASFAVIGATAEVTVVDGPRGLSEIARGRLTHLERRWSRFVASSEISRLNRAAGEPLRVSAGTRLLVRLALEGGLGAGRRAGHAGPGTAAAVVSSEPLTVPNRGESRWAPSAAPEEPPSPQPWPR